MILTTLYLDTTRADAKRDLRTPYDMHRTLARCGDADSRLLFRIEETIGAVRIISDAQVDCSPLESGYAVNAHAVECGAGIGSGDRREFRLWATPIVQRSDRQSAKGRGGRYNLVGAPAQLDWLHRQAERAGFVVMDSTVEHSRSIGGDARKASHEIKQSIPHVGVEFRGLLRVEDSDRFREALRAGIGRGKAFGFGLLLLE